MKTRFLALLFVAGFVLALSNVQTETVRTVTYQDILGSPNNDWLTYGGGYNSQRYSPLNQITDRNVSGLKLKWEFKAGDSENTRGTPLVHNGIMYATNANGVFAINAVNGKEIWYWMVSDKKISGLNRGVALLDDKVFFITGDCKLTALEQTAGKLLWQNKYISGKGYYCTLAPLALKDRIIVGVSVGESSNARGFIASFDSKTGKEIWRFWATPSPNEPGSATWVSGSYDPESDTVYWTTGSPLLNGEVAKRLGDNLYSNCILALDADTGKLKWYFQNTPGHNYHWDSNEVLVLVNEPGFGKVWKLILQANRNGFFYVLDRTNGKFLFGRPFVGLNWAKGLDDRGRPIIPARQEVPRAVKDECPDPDGATNWMAPSFSPKTRLFYTIAFEHCGREDNLTYIKAIYQPSWKVKWQYELGGSEFMFAGIVSTAGNLVFTADKDKNFIALNAETGQPLWKHRLEYSVFASPVSYSVNGTQYVAISAGEKIYVFSLT
jgi:alcohol dehydrogenase (cytochrome c)